MTDPIADMLTRIRNAVTAKHTRVDMPASRLKADIARILQDEGYIQGFKVLEESGDKAPAGTRTLRLFLKYGPHGERLITGVQRISRPGRRVYFGKQDVPEVLAVVNRVMGAARAQGEFSGFRAHTTESMGSGSAGALPMLLIRGGSCQPGLDLGSDDRALRFGIKNSAFGLGRSRPTTPPATCSLP